MRNENRQTEPEELFDRTKKVEERNREKEADSLMEVMGTDEYHNPYSEDAGNPESDLERIRNAKK